jgi:hypothetical protein
MGNNPARRIRFLASAFIRAFARIQPDLGRQIYRATQEIENLMHNGALEPCPDTTSTPG